jgi:hypothetical protein
VSTYNIKKINTISVLKVAPIVLLAQGLFSALLTFCLSFKDITMVDIKAKILTCIIFTISYSIIVLCNVIIMVHIYNILSTKFNKQITIDLDLLKE